MYMYLYKQVIDSIVPCMCRYFVLVHVSNYNYCYMYMYMALYVHCLVKHNDYAVVF